MLYVAAAGSQKTKKLLKKDVDGKEDPCMVG